MVLGGFAGSRLAGGARDRDRLLENSVPAPFAETGEGVCRWPLGWPFERWKSGFVPRFENDEMPDRFDICDEYDDGSAPENGLPPLVVGEDGLLDGGS